MGRVGRVRGARPAQGWRRDHGQGRQARRQRLRFREVRRRPVHPRLQGRHRRHHRHGRVPRARVRPPARARGSGPGTSSSPTTPSANGRRGLFHTIVRASSGSSGTSKPEPSRRPYRGHVIQNKSKGNHHVRNHHRGRQRQRRHQRVAAFQPVRHHRRWPVGRMGRHHPGRRPEGPERPGHPVRRLAGRRRRPDYRRRGPVLHLAL